MLWGFYGEYYATCSVSLLELLHQFAGGERGASLGLWLRCALYTTSEKSTIDSHPVDGLQVRVPSNQLSTHTQALVKRSCVRIPIGKVVKSSMQSNVIQPWKNEKHIHLSIDGVDK